MQSSFMEAYPTTTYNDSFDRLALVVQSGGHCGFYNGGRGCRGGHGHMGGGHGVAVQCFGCGEFVHYLNCCPYTQVNPRFTNIVSQLDPQPLQNEKRTIVIGEEEFNRYIQFQNSQQPSSSSSTTTFVQTGNPTSCLSFSSRHWVIDFGASDHMIMDSVFFLFQSFH